MTLADVPEHLRQFDWYLSHLKWLGVLEEDGIKAKRADLSGMDLREVNLCGANLRRATIYGMDLRWSNLRWVDFTEADISGVNFMGADLRDVNLRGATLYWLNIIGAKGIISFGPVGSAARIGYVVAHESEPMVQLGCWWEPLSKTIKKLKAERTPGYVAIVEAAALVLKEQSAR